MRDGQKATIMTTIADAIAHLAPLLGTWRGEGHGEYPTIASFDYTDEWEFTAPPGKPFVRFIERTWIDGEARHTEVGYLRCPTPDTLEIVAALPTGQAECGSGSVSVDADEDRGKGEAAGPGNAQLTLATDAEVQNTDTAKPVERIVRRFVVSGDQLAYGMEMAAVGEPLTLHLRATLRRIDA